MYQGWRRLTFLHWRYRPEAIESLISRRLRLDTFDGTAWIGLTPFELYDLHAPWMPTTPWLSRFPETNVRTYVCGPDGERGVWFFNLEADRLLAVMSARAAYRLPYRWADMTVTRTDKFVRYRSNRKRPFGFGGTDIVVEPAESISAGPRDNFLTARFRLYSAAGDQLFTAPIEHAPWPLQNAKVVRLQQNLIEYSGVPRPSGTPLAHYSADLKVKIGKIARLAG